MARLLSPACGVAFSSLPSRRLSPPMAQEKRNRNEAQGSGTNDELQPQGVRKRRFPLPLLLGSLSLFLSHRPHNCFMLEREGENKGRRTEAERERGEEEVRFDQGRVGDVRKDPLGLETDGLGERETDMDSMHARRISLSLSLSLSLSQIAFALSLPFGPCGSGFIF
jgi:hypothetical protein